MFIRMILIRLVSLALAILACVWLVRTMSAWQAIAVWAGAMAVLCSATSLLMRSAPPGRVTWINYYAGLVLPAGYRIGRGKLLPIVVTSWIVWVLVGGAVVFLTAGANFPSVSAAQSHSTAPASAIWMVLLFAAWLIDGGAILYLLGTAANSRRRFNPALLIPMLVLAALIAASVVVVLRGDRSTSSLLFALVLSAGPIVLIGGTYGAAMGVMLLGARGRWN